MKTRLILLLAITALLVSSGCTAVDNFVDRHASISKTMNSTSTAELAVVALIPTNINYS